MTEVREVPIEKISPRLRVVVEKLAGNLSGMTERVLTTLRVLIPDYARIQDQAVVRDVHDSIATNARVWYEALLAAQAPSVEALERTSAFARRRVHQGVPIGALLRAYRVGTGVFWRSMLEAVQHDSSLYEEMLYKVSPYLIYHFDLVAQSVNQKYADEQYKRARWRDRLRHELCGIVRDRPEDDSGYRAHMQALGLDATAPHAALALRLVELPGLTSELEDGMERTLIGVARAFGADRERLVRTVHHGDLLLWLPAPHGETMIANEQRLAKQALPLIGAGVNVSAIGIGLPGSGPRGWNLSASQAQKAIDVGVRIRPTETVFLYSDIVLDDAALGSDNITRFLEALIERLSAEPDLLETLQVYFEKQQHRKAVAGALDIHPNTLNYRLERIETLLGAQLADLGWQAKLYTALRLRQISLPESARK